MSDPVRNPDGSYHLPVGEEYVGSSILDIVSGALYSNALDVVREYIQNALDAKAPQVKIVVRQHDILIRDNGKGLNLQQLDNARKVAVSRKGTGEVGFRGIGIYSSFSVCDALEVISRPEGSDRIYSLRVEYAPMRAEIARSREGAADPMPLLKALDLHTRLTDYTEVPPLNEAGSFTLVRLISPTQRFRQKINDVTAVEEYLRSAVPLEFHEDFEHAEAVRSGLKKHGVPLRLIAVSLKPTGARKAVDLRQANIQNLLRPIIKTVHDGSKLVAVMWLCVNRERRVLKPDSAQGFQVRFKSFGIGDRRLLQPLWPGLGSGVLYRHLTGDIHVLDDTLTPSAERGNFEDTHSREVLFDLLKVVFGELNLVIADRRDALGDIDLGDKAAKPERVEQGFANLELVRGRFPVHPPLTPTEILDTRGREVAAKREREAARAGETTEAQHPGDGEAGDTQGGDGGTTAGSAAGTSRGQRQQGGAGTSSTQSGTGGGQDQTEPEPIPTIVEILMSLAIPWPPEAREIFESIDNALVEVVERRNVEACRRMLRELLERRYTYRDDTN